MSTPIDQIVSVSVSVQDQAVEQASFSKPLIGGPTAPWEDVDTTANIGSTSSPVITVASATGLSKGMGITGVGIPNDTTIIDIDGTSVTLSNNPTATGNSVAVTAQDLYREYTSLAGALEDGFETTDPEYPLIVATLAQALRPTSFFVGKLLGTSARLAQQLANIQAAPGGDEWYGLSMTYQDEASILAVAAYIETQLKIFIADSNDADILTSATDDVASELQDDAYNRTAIIYAGEAGDGRAAAWLGGQLPQTPGASTWKFKTLAGITPDDFTTTQRSRCIGTQGSGGKNCNIYETVGGVGITQEGFMSSGRFIDVTVGIDWLQSRMKENVFGQLVNSAKIPYTDAGIAVIENAIRQTLLQGAANGLIDVDTIEVSAPLASEVSSADRASRILPDVTFSCRLAGALHFVVVEGNVSV